MATQIYNSFEDIDRQLDILTLETSIAKARMQLHFSKAKRSLYPKHLLRESRAYLQKTLLTLAIGTVLKGIKRIK